MFLIGLIKLLLIFPFILYVIVQVYIKNKRYTHLIVAPIYTVSLLLWSRYLFGHIIGLIIGILLVLIIVYLTIQMKKPVQLTPAKTVRYSLINIGRMYPQIYVVFFIIGLIQEFLK